MTITYDFGDDYQDDFFEYEVDDLGDFIDSLGKEELVDFVMENVDNDLIDGWELPSNKDELKGELANDDYLLHGLIGELEDAFVECFEDSLEDFYRDDAMEQYEDYKECSRDPYSYYGVSRNDFF